MKHLGSRSMPLASFLEEEYYKREQYKDNIYNILYKNNILDSSLISQSNRKTHQLKLIKCGNYLQFYFYEKSRGSVDKNMEKASSLKILYEQKANTTPGEYKMNEIEEKNITRTKINLQNLVKTNEDIFKTFITLTFADNITDVKEANKIFNVWRRNLKRIKPDFAYVCVPEFQKRGAVHYHMLTNIEYEDTRLLLKEKKIYNSVSGWQTGKNIKGWNYGFSMAKTLKEMNVTGYISKYMTKDIDNRLFGKHRFFYSQNLLKPEEHLIDFNKFQDRSLYDLLGIRYGFEKMTYCATYQDMFGDNVVYCEYKMTD